MNVISSATPNIIQINLGQDADFNTVILNVTYDQNLALIDVTDIMDNAKGKIIDPDC